MKPGPPRRRRARPVADAPVDGLLARVDDLAKGWLLAVVEDAPLEDAPAILASDLPRIGPLLCAAVVRALSDDAELQRLEAGGELEPLAACAGALVGAQGVQDAVRAVEALQSVIWSALREELSYADSDLVSELAERLGLVSDLLRLAALRRSENVTHSAAESEAPAPVAPPVQSEAVGAQPETPAQAAPPVPEPARPAPETAWLAPEVAPKAPADPAPAESPPAESPSVPEPEFAFPPPDPGPGAESTLQAAPPPRAAAGDSGALWLSAFEDEIANALATGAPLSLLRADLDDAERVLAVEPAGEANTTFGRFAQAVRSAVRRQDILVCETDSRAWIIARETARAGAQALGGRIAQAVGEAGPWRGAPLRVSIGVAVLREDGGDSGTLVEAAEEAAFAASASGIGIVRAVPSPMHDDEGPPLAS